MKRPTLLAAAAFVIALLLAFSSSALAQQTGKAMIMRIGHATAPGAPRDLNAQEFARKIGEISKGQIKAEVFPASQLGSNDAMLDAVGSGALEAMIIPTAFSAKVTPAFTLLDLPFLFPNMDKAVEFMLGPEAAALMREVEPKGYKCLAFWPSDFKLMTANKPIEKVEDLKGLKFRVMAGDVLMNTYKGWGASAIPIQLNELYTALAQKTVDAQENTMGTIHDFKFYEVQKYIMESNHSLTADAFLVNKPWFDKLPAEIQKAMVEETRKLAPIRKVQEIERNNGFRKKIAATGKNEFVEISSAEKRRFREAGQLAYDEFVKKNPNLKPILDAIASKYN